MPSTAPRRNSHGVVPKRLSAQYPIHAPPPVVMTNVKPMSIYGLIARMTSIMEDFLGGGLDGSIITCLSHIRSPSPALPKRETAMPTAVTQVSVLCCIVEEETEYGNSLKPAKSAVKTSLLDVTTVTTVVSPPAVVYTIGALVMCAAMDRDANWIAEDAALWKPLKRRKALHRESKSLA